MITKCEAPNVWKMSYRDINKWFIKPLLLSRFYDICTLAFIYLLFSFLKYLKKHLLSFLVLYLSCYILLSHRAPQSWEASFMPYEPYSALLMPLEVWTLLCDGGLDSSPYAATLCSPCPDPSCLPETVFPEHAHFSTPHSLSVFQEHLMP